MLKQKELGYARARRNFTSPSANYINDMLGKFAGKARMSVSPKRTSNSWLSTRRDNWISSGGIDSSAISTISIRVGLYRL